MWFLGSTFAFVALMSVLAAKVKYETGRTIMFRDAIRSESTWEMVYTQVEYVLTIITAQGTHQTGVRSNLFLADCFKSSP